MIWKHILKRSQAKQPEDAARQTTAAEHVAPRQAPTRKTETIIGFDFGTAFTKVVIGVVGQKYGVPLNAGGQGTDKYLLPTPTNLKMQILDGGLNRATRERAIDHIARVLRQSRDWLMTEKKAVFGDAVPDWYVNIGLPAAKHNDEYLREKYQALVENAWHKSIDLNAEQGGGESNNAESKLQRENIGAFPEFAAQMQGYISSQQRQHGLHVLIDIGAGTVDATVFMVHQEEGENIFPLMDASVEMLGTTFLAKHRCNELQKPGAYLPNPHDRFPPRGKFSMQLGVTPEDVAQADLGFRKQIIQGQIFPLLKWAKEEMAPNQDEWKNGIPLMLCGGGARVEFYREVADALVTPKQGYPLREIPLYMPDRLDAPGIPEEDVDRLSVAHGLSFGKVNIAEMTRPQPMPRDEQSPNSRICPRCKGRFLHRLCDMCGGSGYL